MIPKPSADPDKNQKFSYSSFFTSSNAEAITASISLILILAQTAAEDDLLLGFGQLLVFGVECAVLGIIHRIVRLIAGASTRRSTHG